MQTKAEQEDRHTSATSHIRAGGKAQIASSAARLIPAAVQTSLKSTQLGLPPWQWLAPFSATVHRQLVFTVPHTQSGSRHRFRPGDFGTIDGATFAPPKYSGRLRWKHASFGTLPFRVVSCPAKTCQCQLPPWPRHGVPVRRAAGGATCHNGLGRGSPIKCLHLLRRRVWTTTTSSPQISGSCCGGVHACS
jgi:hypothetical protein